MRKKRVRFYPNGKQGIRRGDLSSLFHLLKTLLTMERERPLAPSSGVDVKEKTGAWARLSEEKGPASSARAPEKIATIEKKRRPGKENVGTRPISKGCRRTLKERLQEATPRQKKGQEGKREGS